MSALIVLQKHLLCRVNMNIGFTESMNYLPEVITVARPLNFNQGLLRLEVMICYHRECLKEIWYKLLMDDMKQLKQAYFDLGQNLRCTATTFCESNSFLLGTWHWFHKALKTYCGLIIIQYHALFPKLVANLGWDSRHVTVGNSIMALVKLRVHKFFLMSSYWCICPWLILFIWGSLGSQ